MLEALGGYCERSNITDSGKIALEPEHVICFYVCDFYTNFHLMEISDAYHYRSFVQVLNPLCKRILLYISTLSYTEAARESSF